MTDGHKIAELAGSLQNRVIMIDSYTVYDYSISFKPLI